MGAAGWALVSALFAGLGAVLQQKGALSAPPAGSGRFVGAVVRDRVWLLGAVCQLGSWVTQGLALAAGPLALVQPLVSLQIVIALPLGVALTGQRVGRREWTGAGLVVVAVTVFVALYNPSGGRATAPAGVWLVVTGVLATLAVAAVLAGNRGRPAVRAALFGAAAGIVFGYQAAVMKAFVSVVPAGLHAVLTNWSTYALIASAAAGFYLMQSALQADVLAAAVASSNAACPVAGVVLGRLVFLETPQRTRGGVIVSLVSAAALVAGLVLLARGAVAYHGRADELT